MTDLTYKTPVPLTKPFAVGDTVDVLDRDHAVLGQQRIVRVGKRVTVTDCARRWRTEDGWWIGSAQAYPFPSIRHPK